MACTYTGTIEGDRALATQEKLTEVTDMLCRVLTICESVYTKKLVLPQDIAKFWEEHKLIDEKRMRLESLKESGLAKLTIEERKVLGV